MPVYLDGFSPTRRDDLQHPPALNRPGGASRRLAWLPETDEPARSAPVPSRQWKVAALGVLFVAALLIQVSIGAYRTERGNFSDESAHFMNGLLVRDYLREDLGGNPIAFAEAYYLSYPKIAPGMWPPLFHAILGLLLLPGGPPHIMALGLVALATAWTAWRLALILFRLTSRTVALALAALFLVTPAIVNPTSAVMLDIVVAAFALEAAYWLGLFLTTEDRRHAALFGLFAAGGCLTKGNGVAIVLMVPLLLFFSRRFDLLKRSGLYLAAAVVVVIALPLLGASFYLDAAIGDFRIPNWWDIGQRVAFYTTYLVAQVGWPVLVVGAVGLAGSIDWSVQRRRDPKPALLTSLAALVVAAIVFHVLNPHKTFSGRYVTLAVAPIFALLPAGAGRIAAFVRDRQFRVARAVLAATLVGSAVLVTPALAFRQPLGFREAVSYLDACGEVTGRTMMVISDENGEGAMVAEVAARRPQPAATVIRASKLMASDDWSGHAFRLRYPSAGALLRDLEDLHVDYVIVDRSLEKAHHALWPQTQELLDRQADRLELVHSVSAARSLAIYRLKFWSSGPAKPLQLEIVSPFSTILSR